MNRPFTIFLRRVISVIFLFFILLPAITHAQYFGRNKVSYRSFDFEVVESPHIQLYHYFNNDSTVRNFLRLSEKWYQMHQEVLGDTIRFKNPLILYQNHADFQQTNAISGGIGVGTGGVTEGFKNRVVMPIMESNSQTDHVLGHELVHAFQYNLLRDSQDSSLSLANLRNLPLWMVEGMAEYLSLGRVDAHTAMWMRDAYLSQDIPSINDLNTNPKYFPYRYGQAFWAFVGGVWGDDKILPLYVGTAKYGLDVAADSVLGVNTESLSNMWRESLETHYSQIMPDTTTNMVGKLLLSKENAGEMNISPAISPNGQYVMFLSEINLFTIDLFLADAKTGKIIRKVSSTARESHIDAFSYIESAGAWSPDSRQFAFVAFSKGSNKLIIVDAEKGRTVDEHFIPGVPAFSNPSYSPDGKGVVVTGLVEGQSDLFYYNLQTEEVKRLTNDPYSDLHASFSPDGKTIVFSSDRMAYDAGGYNGRYTFNLNFLNLESGEVSDADFFRSANNLSPIYAPDGENIYFLSNRDGLRNLYRYNIASGQINQMTAYYRGISGITEYAPAISVSSNTGQVVYSYYAKNGYTVYTAEPSDFEYTAVDPTAIDFTAATLPPFSPVAPVIIGTNLSMPQRFGYVAEDEIVKTSYKPQFKLDYIGNTGVGVSTSPFGTGVSGGVAGIASDILGNNQLFGVLSVNGEIYDFGGQFAYLNRKNRYHYGAGISHVPFRTGFLDYVADDIVRDEDGNALQDNSGNIIRADLNQELNLIRIFEEKLELFSALPLSSTRRFEFGVSGAFYSYRIDKFNTYYQNQGGLLQPFYQSRYKAEAPDGFGIATASAAFVGDNSYFGLVGPLQGHRFRIGVERNVGELNYGSVTADFRRYIRMKPFTLALRAMHFGRYGRDSEQNLLLGPIFLGFPGLVHGYDDYIFNAESVSQQNPDTGNVTTNDLIGSRVAVANIELRLPFTGPERLTLLKSRLLFSELNFFFDGGLAWDSSTQQVQLNSNDRKNSGEANNVGRIDIPTRVPVFSSGVGLRINVFGQIIVEPYFAWAFQRADIRGGSFGFNLVPAW